MNQVVLWVAVVSGVLPAARWLRVAQREHYGIGRTSRFARRWWLLDTRNRVLALAAAVGVVLSGTFEWAPAITAAAVGAGPRGLSLRGRSSPLAWTRRLITIASTLTLVGLTLIVVGLLAGVAAPVTAVLLFGMPLWVDITLAILAPLEGVLTRRWVHRAQQRLDKVDPVRVAVTGSYGKTTIKGYLRHLTEGSRAVLATPASFNNTAGVSRTVNEHLTDGTEVFIAEMGTFGPGEIASMTRWVRPSVSVVAAIGPVHLERFGSLDRIVTAKSEIFATSRTAILNVDAYGLSAEADRLAASGLRVIRCSAQDPTADATVLASAAPNGSPPQTPTEKLSNLSSEADAETVSQAESQAVVRRVVLFGREIAVGHLGDAASTNIACAVAAASVLGVSDADIAIGLEDLPTPEHRRTIGRSPSGVTVIDDTYNSNPAGARAALNLLAQTDARRRVLVTGGMVELGRRQAPDNRQLGAHAAQIADDVIIVGRTNRSALLEGSTGWDRAAARRAIRKNGSNGLVYDGASQTAAVHLVASRDEAVAWVRSHLTSGDAVLYENDLPDHYP